jgi:hypothetical protein
MKAHHAHLLLAAVLVVSTLWSSRALADVVMPPPDDCPEGTTPRTGHIGPYCQPPPPAECPPGHAPKVNMARAYCEPPPAEPCPTGSRWMSTSETDVYCQGGWACDVHQCAEGNTCKESSLCVQEIRMFRAGSWEKVSGACTADADCPEGESCVTKKRCDPDVKRGPVEGGGDTPAAPAEPTEEPTEEPAPTAPVVDEPAVDDPDDVPQKGCAVGPAGAGAGVSALVGLLLLVGVLRRR